jgi:hypothetical protein
VCCCQQCPTGGQRTSHRVRVMRPAACAAAPACCTHLYCHVWWYYQWWKYWPGEHALGVWCLAEWAWSRCRHKVCWSPAVRLTFVALTEALGGCQGAMRCTTAMHPHQAAVWFGVFRTAGCCSACLTVPVDSRLPKYPQPVSRPVPWDARLSLSVWWNTVTHQPPAES